jgi:erythromycin esterase
MHSDGEELELIAAIGAAAKPLRSPADLDPLLDKVGDARFVLLGEATHGTSEFYRWRAAITRRLIEEREFSFIAVEGDWPDCYRVNRFVKRLHDSAESAEQVLHAFARWPTWMWANREVIELVEFLRGHNARHSWDRQVGFYGLDVYSLWESMASVIEYLERIDPDAAREARRNYGCFDRFHGDAQDYARSTALTPTSCEPDVVKMLATLRANAPDYLADGRDAYFSAEQNALIAIDAERYYRAMIRGGPSSWNVRDHHMMDTLDRLMTHHGPTAKAIVWEHNTHIGDARFTDMARDGMVNVGQLARQTHEREGVVLVGFATHRGSVIAAREWGAPMQRIVVPPATRGSFEDLAHRSEVGDAFMLFGSDLASDADEGGFEDPLGHRAIGVVYRPQSEQWGNYVPTIIPYRYDAMIYVDETHAVDPLHMPVVVSGEEPDTYPSGM